MRCAACRDKSADQTCCYTQAAPGPRVRDKFVPLPVDVDDVPQAERPEPSLGPAQEVQPCNKCPTTPTNTLSAGVAQLRASATFAYFVSQLSVNLLQGEQPEVGPGTRGRITVYCVSDSLDREMLDKRLKQRGPQFLLHSYPDALYGKYSELEHGVVGDVLYFDYGVVVLWGLSKKQEQDVLKNLVAPCQEAPLPAAKAARDEFQYNYAANEKAHIQNDTVTIDYRLSRNHEIKIAISHALAQSTKLVHFEARVLDIISNTRNLPEHLANTGEILLSKKQIAQLIGTVFIEKSRVNLLSTVLDTPEFFWDAPDSMQSLYERVCEYMELEERVTVLNNRYQVLTEMLDMLRDHQNNSHSAALEWIVIWLIVVCVFVGLFECTALVGWHK